jgi:hypothetical protein
VLGVLAVALIVPRLMPTGPLASFVIECVIVAIMVAVVWRLHRKLPLVLAVVVLALVSEIASLMAVLKSEPSWVVADHVSTAAFLFIVLARILVDVWGQQSVTTDTIVGGVVVYVMLGVAFAGIYQLIEFVAPGSFVASNPGAGNWGEWQPQPGVYPRIFFFSFVTLTTLGYGDLVPASEPAGALTALEAAAGSLYLTILIARLVGLHIAGSRVAVRDD